MLLKSNQAPGQGQGLLEVSAGHEVIACHYSHTVRGASPVIFLLEVADGNEPGATADSEFVLSRGPFHAASSSVNPQDDQGRLPGIALQGPYVGITVSPAGDNTIALWGPIDAWEGGRNQTQTAVKDGYIS